MTQYVKFSDFPNATLSNSTNKSVGFAGSVNYKTPATNTWTTAGRPTPPYNGLSGYNTDLSRWEYFTADGNQWLQFDTSTIIQGSWIPVDASGASLVLVAAGSYTKIANVVTAWCNITYPPTADGSAAIIGGLPIVGGGNTKNGASVVFSNVSTLRYALMNGGGSPGTTVNLYNSSGVAIINSAMSSSTLYLQFNYGI